ncbi:MAG: hypothetical protein WDW36_001839 [Sanguina aurantia]
MASPVRRCRRGADVGVGGAVRRADGDDAARIIAPQTGPRRRTRDSGVITTRASARNDNLGNAGRTEAGDVQVMSAGTGITHSQAGVNRKPRPLPACAIQPDRASRARRAAPRRAIAARSHRRRIGGTGSLVRAAAGRSRDVLISVIPNANALDRPRGRPRSTCSVMRAADAASVVTRRRDPRRRAHGRAPLLKAMAARQHAASRKRWKTANCVAWSTLAARVVSSGRRAARRMGARSRRRRRRSVPHGERGRAPTSPAHASVRGAQRVRRARATRRPRCAARQRGAVSPCARAMCRARRDDPQPPQSRSGARCQRADRRRARSAVLADAVPSVMMDRTMIWSLRSVPSCLMKSAAIVVSLTAAADAGSTRRPGRRREHRLRDATPPIGIDGAASARSRRAARDHARSDRHRRGDRGGTALLRACSRGAEAAAAVGGPAARCGVRAARRRRAAGAVFQRAQRAAARRSRPARARMRDAVMQAPRVDR